MNEGGNGGENQGAVNDQRRRMRCSSFANLPPPRGKVCEKIVEEVVDLIKVPFHVFASMPIIPTKKK